MLRKLQYPFVLLFATRTNNTLEDGLHVMSCYESIGMTTALYPGTFDPITLGHIDIIERALHLFDEVTIAIATSASKKPIFTLEERIEHVEKIFKGNDRVKAIGFTGLVVDLAKEQNSNILIRGLRAVSDFEYEFQLAAMNRRLDPSIETMFLTPSEKYTFLSASMVKEIATHGGDVSQFLHPEINKRLGGRLGR